LLKWVSEVVIWKVDTRSQATPNAPPTSFILSTM
jgi:hypothetical protein